MNRFITTYFGLGILIAIILGILFPSVAQSMINLGIFFLFILMFLSGINLEWLKLKQASKKSTLIIISMFYIFLVIPFLIYLISKFLFSDVHLIYGTVFAALTPVAIVAPFFTDMLDGNKELSFVLLLLSMLLCPFITPIILSWLIGPLYPVSTWLIFKNMLIIIPLPLLVSYLIQRFFPRICKVFSRNIAFLNFISLFFLIFILFGVTVFHLNLSYISFWVLTNTLAKLLLVTFIQDFGIFFLSWFLFSFLVNKETNRALKVSFSMKNIAIAAGLLLLHDPRAAIAPAIGFIAHASLFNAIPVFKKWLK